METPIPNSQISVAIHHLPPHTYTRRLYTPRLSLVRGSNLTERLHGAARLWRIIVLDSEAVQKLEGA